MSEDRLDSALQAMRDESVDAAEIAGARARVLTGLTGIGDARCRTYNDRPQRLPDAHAPEAADR